MSPVQIVTYVTGVDRRYLARPRGETSNSFAAERLFAELVEWTEYLKGPRVLPESARGKLVEAALSVWAFYQRSLPSQMAGPPLSMNRTKSGRNSSRNSCAQPLINRSPNRMKLDGQLDEPMPELIGWKWVDKWLPQSTSRR